MELYGFNAKHYFMNAIQDDYFSNIDVVIDEIKKNHNNSLLTTQKIVAILEDKISELRNFLEKYKFRSVEKEIHFFKEQKPLLVSKLIFYNKIIEVEANMSFIKKDKIDFIELMLNKVQLIDTYNCTIFLFKTTKQMK